MTGRERMLEAAGGRLPDKIPFTYSAAPEADAKFRNEFGLKHDAGVGDYFGCCRFISLWEVLGEGFSLPEREERQKKPSPAIRTDIWGCERRLVKAGAASYFEISKHPLAGAQTVADVESYDWPEAGEIVFPDIPEGLDFEEKSRDGLVLDGSFIGPFGIPWSMLGMEKMMTDIILNPGLVEAVVAKTEEFTLSALGMFLERYSPMVDLISCGDDYGTQNGLMMSKSMLDRFFMPSLGRHYALGRKHAATGYHHCCGAIFEIIPSLIEAGVEVLNPVQTSAAGMVPEKLKEAFGGSLAFHGGIDIQQTIVTGSPEEVRAEVRERIETLGPGGYILAPSHNLQADTPAENVAAMYDEAANYKIRT